ncbi:nicotinamide phosphoribosyltransferase-like [Sycon ciliatum]|uniref:nicotinamide phosphoribosyltransferase-like n=1 Tax=Sycon ciliatum TaxID=27933 RepID=UPI0020AE3980|eukprot:scpid42601/ scgid11869/ Nicotinamide phosphoribosyltransferase; Pre-B-cell colony-enhancing factor 1 homolog; Visfatin
MEEHNIMLFTDSYKITHHYQYPPNMTKVYSYFESRGGVFPEILFFGLQYYLKRWLAGQVVTEQKIIQAREILKLHFGADHFNEEGWRYILEKHGGRLPIRVKSVPEGTLVNVKNVLFTVENTDPNVAWLPNYLETLFVQTWYPMTVATNSFAMKVILASYLHDTAESLDGLPFKLHDFGFRGVSSHESAGLGGMSHLVNFAGTDTLSGLVAARTYYDSKIAGFSIPAAEHSTMTSWGKDGESAAFRNMLDRFPEGMVAVVSDSYDIWNACEKIWGEELKEQVIKRGEKGGVLVIRPDSGDPATTVCQVLDILGKKFGFEMNSKGFKQLPKYLRVIQGDGISYETFEKILAAIKAHGWSMENLAFGSGGGLLQRINRDTQKVAMKCSYAVVDGKGMNVFKQPITDPGKTSKKGLLTLQPTGVDGKFETIQEGKGDPEKDAMVPVFENGDLLLDWKFDDIKAKAEAALASRIFSTADRKLE